MSDPVVPSDQVTIFLSHSSANASLAKTIRLGLQALEDKITVKVLISEEMPGGTEWREWIDSNVKRSDIFLLIYPRQSMDMSWCNYELGRFYEHDRPVICLRNTNIAEPPPTFRNFQAYTADEANIRKFLNELFVKGEFTPSPLNPKVGRVGSEFYLRAEDVAKEIAEEFAQARAVEYLFQKRVVFNLNYLPNKKLDFNRSTVAGNEVGLELLGVSRDTSWAELLRASPPCGEWLSGLEEAIATIPTGASNPALPPFTGTSGTHIPIVSRAESVDGTLKEVAVIFAQARREQLLPLLNWTFPQGIPENLSGLLKIVRLIFKARWEVLEPRFQEVRFQSPTEERCAQINAELQVEYKKIQVELEREGYGRLEQFNSMFDKTMRRDMDKAAAQWYALMEVARTNERPSRSETRNLLSRLLANNGKYISFVSRQFNSVVEEYGEEREENMPDESPADARNPDIVTSIRAGRPS